jgi:cell division protein FtsB
MITQKQIEDLKNENIKLEKNIQSLYNNWPSKNIESHLEYRRLKKENEILKQSIKNLEEDL